MGKKSIETLVGLFVLAGIVALVFLALKAANLGSFDSGDSYALFAKFDNIGGRVTSNTLDPKTYQGVVKLQIQKGVQLPDDSSARILTAGLLGDQYLGIEPGG